VWIYLLSRNPVDHGLLLVISVLKQQIIYLFLMTGGIYIFFQTTWKQIPGPAVSSIHRWSLS